MVTTVFPSDLRSDKFQYRMVRIKIMKSDIKMGSIDEMQKYATERVDKIKSVAVDSVGSDDSYLKTVTKSLAAFKGAVNTGTCIEEIYLPLPNELSDSHSHDWGTTTGLVKTLADKVSNGVTNAMGSAVSMISDASSIRKPLLDPGYYQDYTGTQPRDFSFSFDFLPSNQEEAETMLKIIHKLRRYSLPEMAISSALILAPHYFDVELTNPYINDIVNMQGVVLSNMSVNYGADGQMQQTYDGIPKYIQVSLSFRERKMSTSNMYTQKV